MIHKILTLFVVVFLASPLQAQIPENVRTLNEAMGLTEIIEIMRDEGISYGDELAEEMFPGRGDALWQSKVVAIYDWDRMHDLISAGVAEGLQGVDIYPLSRFFESEAGREIISLEVSARRAMADDEVEAASIETTKQMFKDEHPRLILLEEFVSVNDLLERNIVGALNSNLAFYYGLEEGGAFREPLTEDEILADVWSQEDSIREETNEWLYAYLALAYQPLSDDKLSDYIDLSMTSEGQALNAALFLGFNRMFDIISRELGRAAAEMMTFEDL